MKKENKVSSVRLVISKEHFNRLVSLADCKDKVSEIVVSSLYDKLMKFSFIKENKNVELRLFPFEASQVILLLLCNIDGPEVKKNYFKKLKKSKIKKGEDISC